MGAYKQVIRLKPDRSVLYADLFLRLGEDYLGRQQYGKALEAYRSALRFEPEGPLAATAHGWIGTTYVLMGKKDEALQVYRTLERLDRKAAQELLGEINKIK